MLHTQCRVISLTGAGHPSRAAEKDRERVQTTYRFCDGAIGQVFTPRSVHRGQYPIAPVTSATVPKISTAAVASTGNPANAPRPNNAMPMTIRIGLSIPPTLHVMAAPPSDCVLAPRPPIPIGFSLLTCDDCATGTR